MYGRIWTTDKRAHKSLRKLLRELQRQGFRYELSGRLHWKVFGVDGMMVATLPGTTSDRRSMKNSMKNSMSELRRAGFDDSVCRLS